MVPQKLKSFRNFSLVTLLLFLVNNGNLAAQSQGSEADYYQISTMNIPENIVLEASGLTFNDDGQLAVTTRRGEVWLITDPQSDNPAFEKFGQGLHEPLGIAYRNGAYYIAQRGELTRLEDTNNDGRADLYTTIYRWPLSGNYHEYSYGPVFLPDGDMLVNLNLSWIGYGSSLVEWRGWMLRITEEGEMTPVATGLRSPLGFGLNAEGDIFYTENQGDWVGSGWMTHLESGDFAGNPHGLRWTDMPGSPLDLKFEDIDDSQGLTLYEQSKNIPELKNPAVWFPHTIMGISTSDFIVIENDNQVGPFEGQMLVGDQGHSKIMRVYHEKVNGEYQGAVFGFREGFSSGIIKLKWGADDEIYVGMTNRGWGSTGRANYGIERLKWNGQVPFEMQRINAESNGFTITFTKPVSHHQAADINNYQVTDFTYRYDSAYGSPVINRQDKTITRLEIAEDMMSVRLYVDGLREGYINEISLNGVGSSDGDNLLHPVGYYTLNYLPDGERSAVAEGTGVDTDEDGAGERSAKKITEMPSEWTNGPDLRIDLATEPGLRYDQDVITVEAGSRVALTFNNDDDMAHNVVIVEPGTADEVGVAAMNLGLDADALEFVPRIDDVLYHTSMLEPEQTETIYFTVPDIPGDYVYVCTFPGHYISMRGILRVE
ncbi:MAG: plastocyanin/azurin family copper-binding protein [Balneolaceae bacterium]